MANGLTTTVIDPFHQQLRAELESDLEELKTALCNNMARDFLEYKYRCGSIVALQQVLDKCAEVEARMYGERKKALDDD